LVLRRKRAPSAMDAVSGATERPCPHRIRVVTHEYEDIYGRSTQNAKLFQSVISPKAAVNRKMPRLPDNLPRFFCLTARRLCHITWREIRTGSVLMLPAPFCLLSARISDRNAILSGRERSSTPGAVSRRLHPQRRQNIRQESVANAVKRTHILAADVLRPS